VYRVAEGSTGDELAAFLTSEEPPAGPPPIAGSTGVSAMNSGERNVLEADLTPGEYLFICFVPDAETGAPHFTEGMVTTVTIE
jgi:hypothetical protein